MITVDTALFNKRIEEADARNAYTSNRVIRYFPDTFLGNGHQGLSAIAEKKGLTLSNLKVGEFVIFVNKKQTGLKLFTSGNIVAYLKMPGSQRLNVNVIAKIPRFFNGTEINYDKALKEVILKQFKAH